METVEMVSTDQFEPEFVTVTTRFFKEYEACMRIPGIHNRIQALTALTEKHLDPDLKRYAITAREKLQKKCYKQSLAAGLATNDLALIEKTYEQMLATHGYQKLREKALRYYHTALKRFIKSATVEEMIALYTNKSRLCTSTLRAVLLRRIFERKGYL